MAEEPDLGILQVDAGGCLKQLHQCPILIDLQDLAAADLSVCKFNLTQLVVGDILHAADQHQRSGNFLYGAVFLGHNYSSSFPTRSAICLESSSVIFWYAPSISFSGVYL